MRASWMIAAVYAGLLLAGCGSPVPDNMFATLSVSTRDLTVETRINSALEEYVSGGAGLVSSAPINRRVREGDNLIVFTLTPASPKMSPQTDPSFVASLEILRKGEIVAPLTPGPRGVFLRELSDADAARLAAGETIVMKERFTIDREALGTM